MRVITDHGSAISKPLISHAVLAPCAYGLSYWCIIGVSRPGRQSSLTTLLFLPGSSQADRSIPSPIKLSLDRPELGSNPHGSPRRQRRLIAVCEPTPKKKTPRALTRRPPTSIPQNKTIVYGHALAGPEPVALERRRQMAGSSQAVTLRSAQFLEINRDYESQEGISARQLCGGKQQF